tara:strand:+ start:10488 stop:11663 length:1176 start_codon:yes stop_codon:yes gene_type:complete
MVRKRRKKKMVKETKKKKEFQNHKGNKVKQTQDFPFIENFNKWRTNCQQISGGDLQVKNIPNLYNMLKNHLKDPYIRGGSRNDGRDGEGAVQFLNVIEGFVDNPDNLFTVQQAQLIARMANTLEKMKDTGKDIGGDTPAYDPAFILFTEKPKSATGETLAVREVQGHYATEWYAERNEGVSAVPKEWLAGNNPPHQALFSETATKYAKPKGLLYIMKDAENMEKETDLEVEVDTIPSGVDEVDIDEIKSVEDFFNGVIKNTAFWNAGGKLLVNKLRSELQATEFKVKPNEQNPIREIANLGRKEERDALVGNVISFKLTATALPIIGLVDRALKRANTNKAPNGFRAWQNARKGGFDYRKTAREKFGEDTGKYSPDAKIISKMWQQLLWRN